MVIFGKYKKGEIKFKARDILRGKDIMTKDNPKLKKIKISKEHMNACEIQDLKPGKSDLFLFAMKEKSSKNSLVMFKLLFLNQKKLI
jgi:hypothetical protein